MVMAYHRSMTPGTESMRRVIATLARWRGRGIADLAYAFLWRAGARFVAPSAVHQAVFTRIYEGNEWRDPESRSGPGSSRARGADITADLVDALRSLRVRTLLDAPCGDFNWMGNVTSSLASYVGIDVVRPLIQRNQQLYGDSRHRFVLGDVTHDPLPPADAILCRDALVHFSFADIWSAISNFKRSGAVYLLATTFEDTLRNEDIRTGGWRPLNLRAGPFHFPEPLAVIDDVPRAAREAFPAKRLAVWRLGDLRGPDD